MNMFDFIIEICEFSMQGVLNFIVSFTMISLVGIFLTAMLNTISNFRLFNIERKDNAHKVLSNIKTDENTNSNVYDMLIKAWEKRKGKNNS